MFNDDNGVCIRLPVPGSSCFCRGPSSKVGDDEVLTSSPMTFVASVWSERKFSPKKPPAVGGLRVCGNSSAPRPVAALEVGVASRTSGRSSPERGRPATASTPARTTCLDPRVRPSQLSAMPPAYEPLLRGPTVCASPHFFFSGVDNEPNLPVFPSLMGCSK